MKYLDLRAWAASISYHMSKETRISFAIKRILDEGTVSKRPLKAGFVLSSKIFEYQLLQFWRDQHLLTLISATSDWLTHCI